MPTDLETQTRFHLAVNMRFKCTTEARPWRIRDRIATVIFCAEKERERERATGVRWPRGCGSLMEFAIVQRFKWGKTLERSKVRSLCVRSAWHLRGLRRRCSCRLATPALVEEKKRTQESRSTLSPHQVRVLFFLSSFPQPSRYFPRIALFPRATRLITKWRPSP